MADLGLKFILLDGIRKEVLKLDENLVSNFFRVLGEALTYSSQKQSAKIN
jgi:hypothetical protein